MVVILGEVTPSTSQHFELLRSAHTIPFPFPKIGVGTSSLHYFYLLLLRFYTHSPPIHQSNISQGL